ncbi:hypothetical protein HZF05_19715 [Sphingomonas sp. CGMCC 1.13654]|uniref:Uncharacterized protein n=2 Tax=Sphingomonas chungangi TaxID=2683589 RepID=A0A838LDV3_9SPHN|nr:hypothetical protein [Sphingomonas chungangi]MVW55701.1 hypothetical protein [Sphingomonas chungangi]
MSSHVMIILIVAMVIGARIYRDRCASRGQDAWGPFGGRRRNNNRYDTPRQGFGGGGADDAENQRLREEVRALKDRIAVLERIATDSPTQLDREIEALRDRPYDRASTEARDRPAPTSTDRL